MIVTYSAAANAWIVAARTRADDSEIRCAGWQFCDQRRVWFTRTPDLAAALARHFSERSCRALAEACRCMTARGNGPVLARTGPEELSCDEGWNPCAPPVQGAPAPDRPLGEVPLREEMERLAKRCGALLAEAADGSGAMQRLDELMRVGAPAFRRLLSKWASLPDRDRLDVEERARELAWQSRFGGDFAHAQDSPDRRCVDRMRGPDQAPSLVLRIDGWYGRSGEDPFAAADGDGHSIVSEIAAGPRQEPHLRVSLRPNGHPAEIAALLRKVAADIERCPQQLRWGWIARHAPNGWGL